MSAPTLDTPTGSHTDSSTGRRRHRKQLVLVAGTLLVLAVAVGTSLAIATRPVAHQTPAAAAQPTAAQPAAGGQQPDQGVAAQPPAKPGSGQASAAAGAATPALENGDHDAYITKVDRANNRIVVDVVQVFHDDQAVQAAIADGKSRDDAQYLTTWVRNQNPRLRTLPLAGNVAIQLRGGCEEDKSKDALLTKLAANASQHGTYYYTLSVADGKVRRIQEQLAINAC
jgi:hypothetical protein